MNRVGDFRIANNARWIMLVGKRGRVIRKWKIGADFAWLYRHVDAWREGYVKGLNDADADRKEGNS